MEIVETNDTLCSKCHHLLFVRFRVKWNNGGKGRVAAACTLMPTFFEVERKRIGDIFLDVNGLPIVLKCGKFRKKA